MSKHVVFRPRVGQVTVILLYQIIFSAVNRVLLGCMLLLGSAARIKSLRLKKKKKESEAHKSLGARWL